MQRSGACGAGPKWRRSQARCRQARLQASWLGRAGMNTPEQPWQRTYMSVRQSEIGLVRAFVVGPLEVVGLANDGRNREPLAFEARLELARARLADRLERPVRIGHVLAAVPAGWDRSNQLRVA